LAQSVEDFQQILNDVEGSTTGDELEESMKSLEALLERKRELQTQHELLSELKMRMAAKRRRDPQIWTQEVKLAYVGSRGRGEKEWGERGGGRVGERVGGEEVLSSSTP
jgi:hypothetical protein